MADISQINLPNDNNNPYDIKDAGVPHSSLPAQSGGTDLSLVTTGEKYIWNSNTTLSGLQDTDLTDESAINCNFRYDATDDKWEAVQDVSVYTVDSNNVSKELVRLYQNSTYGGAVRISNVSASNRAIMYVNQDDKGVLNLFNASAIPIIQLTSDTYGGKTMLATDSNGSYRVISGVNSDDGGYINVANTSGVIVGYLYTDTNGGGQLNLTDISGTSTITLTGSDGNVQATSLNGVAIGSTPKFTDTTYSAGTGISLSNGAFSVKTGYTTSGNNRKVETDSDGNLYVVQKDDNTTYSAGAGLTLSGTTFKTNVPRVTENARTLPGNNTITFKEYNSSSSNLPSSAWYYIIAMQGGDANYGAQLALGMTTGACYYQVKNANNWSGWRSLINTDSNVSQTASTTNNNDYEVILSGEANNTSKTQGVLKSSRFRSNPANGQTYWRDANRTRIYGEPNTGKAEGYNNSGGMNWSLRGDTGQIVCVYVTTGSSRKIKENIKPIEDSDKVLQLQAVSFDYKDKNRGTDKRGFIAEDVAKVLPNVTTPETFDTPMGINYTELIPYLQDVVKKQEARISALEEQIQNLLNEKESNK